MIRQTILSIVAGVALGLALTLGARSTSADFSTPRFGTNLLRKQ